MYHREWDKFCQFMDSVIIQSSCPASSKSIALYVTHLKRDKNYKVSSIRTSLSAISYNHKMKCFTNPCDSFMIEKLLLSNQKSEKPTVQKPITLAVLQQIISYIRDSHSYQKLLFNAIFSIMYHGALRIGEVCKTPTAGHTLQLSNVKIKYSDSANVKIRFKSHKHQHSPTSLYLPATRDISCPVRNLKKYLRCRSSTPGPIFCHPGGSALTRPEVLSRLRGCLRSAGHKFLKYTVYPKKYAHGFCFAVLCCGYTLTDFPISIRLTSLALWQSNDCLAPVPQCQQCNNAITKFLLRHLFWWSNGLYIVDG